MLSSISHRTLSVCANNRPDQMQQCSCFSSDNISAQTVATCVIFVLMICPAPPFPNNTIFAQKTSFSQGVKKTENRAGILPGLLCLFLLPTNFFPHCGIRQLLANHQAGQGRQLYKMKMMSPDQDFSRWGGQSWGCLIPFTGGLGR